MVLHLVSYAAIFVAFLFVTLSLASGLLYIAEVIEEHSQSAKKHGRQAIYCVIGAHILFCVFDSLPVKHTLLGILCHLVYLSNFSRSWPFVSLLSPSFIASCCLVIVDHFAWFFYFADRASHPKHRQPYRPSWDDGRQHNTTDLSFMDVATFFGLCVWLVPFFLFLSLSANDNVLPSLSAAEHTPTIAQQPPTPTEPNGMSSSRSLPAKLSSLAYSGQTSPTHPHARSSLLRNVLETLLSAFPTLRRSPQQAGRTGSRQNEGIIATPSLSSPPSPAVSNAAQWGTPSQSYFGLNAPYSPVSPPPASPGFAGVRSRPTTPRRGSTVPSPSMTLSATPKTTTTPASKAAFYTRRASPAARALAFGEGDGASSLGDWSPVSIGPPSPLGQAFNPESPSDDDSVGH